MRLDDTSTATPNIPDAAEIIAAMCPWLRQIGAEQCVEDEGDGDDRHDRAGRAPRRFQEDHDEDDAEHDVELERRGRAVGELLAALQRIEDDADGGDRRDDVPPADAVAVAQRQWKQQERQHQRERHMHVTQRLRGDDGSIGERPGARDGGVEMEQRHRNRDARDGGARPAYEPVGDAIFLLDEFFRLAQGLGGNFRLARRL
jgi:hypothetical protein